MNSIIKISAIIKRKGFSYFLIFSILLIVIAVFFLQDIFFPEENCNKNEGRKTGAISKDKESLNDKGTIKGKRHPLNGRFMGENEIINTPVAAMIDNHEKARPAYGLNMADIVFEAEVEGGITRYLAIFSDDRIPEKLGPIRSARPYFIDWASGVSALFIHCGGSPQALAQIAVSDIKNLNEFYRSGYFWRDQTLKRPHNIFTSGEKLKELLKDETIVSAWNFKELTDVPHQNVKHKEISVEYDPPYDVKWEYKRGEGYTRYLAGNPHRAGDGNAIKASNIIIQINPATVQDEKLRLKMNTLGAGKAFICSEGICRKGEWRKKNRSDRIKYYEKNGEMAELAPGLTWIQAIRSIENINISNYDFK
jgi:hypothetical protein